MPPSERAVFYQQHLDRVSRSFAFCIARLESPLREQVGLGYLLCRIVDTVEDADWESFAVQEKAFLAFDSFIRERPTPSKIGEWIHSFPDRLPESEKLLLFESSHLFNDFHDLPKAVHQCLQNPILSMSAGMRHYMRQKSNSGTLRLETLADVNRYCFFVAGVVGEMLTHLLLLHSPTEQAKSVSWLDAFRFGLFLQKVNLLKDQSGDEKEGRFLVPSRALVRASLKQDAEMAFRYLTSLPVKMTGFRLFCAWSLFLGLASLPWIESTSKIPREQTAELLAAVESRISDDESLKELYAFLRERSALPASHPDASLPEGSSDESTLISLYHGVLAPDQIRSLFQGA